MRAVGRSQIAKGCANPAQGFRVDAGSMGATGSVNAGEGRDRLHFKEITLAAVWMQENKQIEKKIR